MNKYSVGVDAKNMINISFEYESMDDHDYIKSIVLKIESILLDRFNPIIIHSTFKPSPQVKETGEPETPNMAYLNTASSLLGNKTPLEFIREHGMQGVLEVAALECQISGNSLKPKSPEPIEPFFNPPQDCCDSDMAKTDNEPTEQQIQDWYDNVQKPFADKLKEPEPSEDGVIEKNVFREEPSCPYCGAWYSSQRERDLFKKTQSQLQVALEALENLEKWLPEHIAYAENMIRMYKKYETLPEKGWFEMYSGCKHTATIVLDRIRKIRGEK